MDAGGIGAFLQRAVVKTFSLPQFMPNTEPTHIINSQSDSLSGCWPRSPEAADLQPPPGGPLDAGICELPIKRTRSASIPDGSRREEDAKVSSTVPQDTATSLCHDIERYDYRRSPPDTDKEPDSEPGVERQGFQPQYFGEESNDVGMNRGEHPSFPACHEQANPQRLPCFEEDMFDGDMCTDDLVHDTLFVSGPTRTLTINDDGKDRLAMLITEEMVDATNDIKKAKGNIAKETRKLKAAETEGIILAMQLQDLKERLGDARDERNASEIRTELETKQTKLQKNPKKIDAIKKGMRPYEFNLQRATNQLQTSFEDILPAITQWGQDPLETQSSNGETEMETDSKPHAEQLSDTSSHSEDQSESEKDSESSLLSAEELLRRSATEELCQSLGELIGAQARFDNRHAVYKQELAIYYQRTDIGSVTYTRTDFDVYMIQHVQVLTKRLKKAEIQYEAARSQAKALGLSLDPYSDYVFEDGYRESEEASILPKVDRTRIEEWSAKVVSPGESEVFSEEDNSEVVIDEWNSRPVETTESCSVVDFQGYGGDIKVWQKHCDTVRELFIEPQQEEIWGSAPTSMRRRSI